MLFDGVVSGGEKAADTLAGDGRSMEFLKDQYHHFKPILMLGVAQALLAKAGILTDLPPGKKDPSLILARQGEDGLKPFVVALAAHRIYGRESDRPRV